MAVVNLIINLWILYNEGNFVTSIATSGCLMKCLLVLWKKWWIGIIVEQVPHMYMVCHIN